MCLIVFAWRMHRAAPLLLAANRDEFHARPTAAAAYWSDAPGVLAGRDLEAGGTWLGISRGGRFAAITNVRDADGGGETATLRSRGELTSDWLRGEASARAYLGAVAARSNEYRGFNLLIGDGHDLWYLHGATGEEPRRLGAGIYGLSNAALDVPWAKVRRGRERLLGVLEAEAAPGHGHLRSCISSRDTQDATEVAGDDAMQRALSAQFIVTPRYGTRCQTTLRCLADGARELREERYDARGASIGSATFRLPPD
jgi:uncharacterized protein with NRDE domain